MRILAQNKSIGDSIIDWANGLVPKVVSDSNSYFNALISIVLVIVFILWIYCGIIIYRDASRKYNFKHKWTYALILLIGAIGGPIALIIYRIVKPQHSSDELEFIKVEHKFYYHQASKVVDCLNCGAYVLEDHTYCTNCGIQNRFKCTKCQTLTDYDDLFCYSCGNTFGKRSEELLEKYSKLPSENNETRESFDFSTVKKSFASLLNKGKDSLQKVKEKLPANNAASSNSQQKNDSTDSKK